MACGGGGGGGRGGPDYITKLQENLTCGLCLDIFNHEDRLPKVIPCQHSFCSACLTGLLTANRGYTVPCPICRETFRVPSTSRHAGSSGIAKTFPTNLALKNLIDILKDEELVAEKAKRRTCTKHTTQEVVMVCQSCRVDVCPVCIKTGGHHEHDLQDLATAYEVLRTEIDKVILPDLSDLVDKCERNLSAAHGELSEWQDMQQEIIEGRAVGLIAQICAWRDRNKTRVEDIFTEAMNRLKESADCDSIEPIKEEIKTRQAVSFGRLAELEKMREHLLEMAEQDLQVVVPEIHLSDNVGINLPDLVTVETVSNVAPSIPPPQSGIRMELVASVTLMEQNWLESHPLHVYDSAGGTNNDILLITDSGLMKYELINSQFRQIWAKPLPKLGGKNPGSQTPGASLFRVFISAPSGDVILRAYPSTVRLNPYLESKRSDDIQTQQKGGSSASFELSASSFSLSVLSKTSSSSSISKGSDLNRAFESSNGTQTSELAARPSTSAFGLSTSSSLPSLTQQNQSSPSEPQPGPSSSSSTTSSTTPSSSSSRTSGYSSSTQASTSNAFATATTPTSSRPSGSASSSTRPNTSNTFATTSSSSKPSSTTTPAPPGSLVYHGDYGQLVGVGDDRLLYWTRPMIHVYRLPGHQLLCELAPRGSGTLWSWVAVSVHPWTREMTVIDWGTKTMSTFSAEGAPLSCIDLQYTPAPYKSCTSRNDLLVVTEYSGRALHFHRPVPGPVTTTTSVPKLEHHPQQYEVRTCHMGLGDGEEITSCLGWGDEDVREGRKGSAGVLTLLVNGNGTKRLVAYRVLVNEEEETVVREQEEQEATINVL